MTTKVFTREEIGEQFKQADRVIVTFLKKDKSRRTMVCTQKLDMIPKDQQPKGSDRAKPKDTMAVFDLEKGGWRSFNIASVISITAVQGA